MSAQRWLSNAEIREIAEDMVNNYEMSCEWSKARVAGADFARERFGFHPSKSGIALALKIARSIWLARTMAVKTAVDND